MKTWKLQDAKARFNELFREARTKGPQRVTRNGKEAVVVVSAEEYEKLAPEARPVSLHDLLVPLRGSGLVIEREQDTGRDVELPD